MSDFFDGTFLKFVIDSYNSENLFSLLFILVLFSATMRFVFNYGLERSKYSKLHKLFSYSSYGWRYLALLFIFMVPVLFVLTVHVGPTEVAYRMSNGKILMMGPGRHIGVFEAYVFSLAPIGINGSCSVGSSDKRLYRPQCQEYVLVPEVMKELSIDLSQVKLGRRKVFDSVNYQALYNSMRLYDLVSKYPLLPGQSLPITHRLFRPVS
jgi:hypothetical protein